MKERERQKERKGRQQGEGRFSLLFQFFYFFLPSLLFHSFFFFSPSLFLSYFLSFSLYQSIAHSSLPLSLSSLIFLFLLLLPHQPNSRPRSSWPTWKKRSKRWASPTTLTAPRGTDKVCSICSESGDPTRSWTTIG